MEPQARIVFCDATVESTPYVLTALPANESRKLPVTTSLPRYSASTPYALVPPKPVREERDTVKVSAFTVQQW